VTYMQIPTTQLPQIGTALRSLASELESQHSGAQDCAGLDPTDHGRLLSAVEGFRGAWNASLRGLFDHITRNGDAAIAIGQLAGDTDARLAESLRPRGAR
jgi:hypothetical protein